MTASDTKPRRLLHARRATEAAPPGGPGAVERALRVAVPLAMLALLVALWQWLVTAYEVPHFILPGPGRVAEALVTDWPVLGPALLVTLKIALAALVLAMAGGIGLAILLAQSRWIELALSPYAVILQVTPVVAIAPLILVYVPSTQVALLIVAFVVAFFPVLSNATLGLKSTDHNLLNLFELYGAKRWQILLHLQIPGALPYFLAGLRIAGGLALIAAVVAEFAAGSAGRGSGLAFRLLESQFRSNTPRLFAALVLLSLTGVAIWFATSAISYFLLRNWHESALRRDR